MPIPEVNVTKMVATGLVWEQRLKSEVTFQIRNMCACPLNPPHLKMTPNEVLGDQRGTLMGPSHQTHSSPILSLSI